MDETQTTTQQPLPGAAGTTAAAAPAGPDVAALQRDHGAALKALEKTTKEFEALKKRMESPEFVAEALQKVLGVDKKADPLKELEAIRGAATTATQEAQTWKGRAFTMARKQAAVDALDRADVEPKYRGKALALMGDALGSLDMDEESLSVKDAAALDKIATGLKADVPVFFRVAAAPEDKKQAAPQNTGTPFHVPGVPPPTQAGQSPGGIDIFSTDPLSILGIGQNAIPIAQIRALPSSRQ